MKNIWAYPADVGYQGQEPLTGFTVETPDGTLGQVERQMNEPGRQHLIVDTSVWVFGASLLVPAGIVHSVDTAAKTVTVTHARDKIKAAPRFAFDSQTAEVGYLTEVGRYYASLGQPAAL
ncbi:hypothetical protein SAMN05428945_5418 [Streptomyces sp. 2224.1]|uniref:hypothetical protein n=1 Tax=unclassified Streptomyces TaxID=2593676 RepID=UPI000890867E|nr:MULTISPECIES: hypothetical protein [unclassified Streptomyces]PBC86990.1 hypothetical protein BX261_7115 [Streptomyces sp. 2321.6]SDQ65359.1 hypothetical protein SAMN05216511_0135 [Streptomyces sp. KS_16]SED32915.1 hypothetical protein SAMN05428954_0101 [Streptomyces sp. 2112.3]SED75831.1 hypothetical protein SAMN05428945_5418 [Streptomyces sp. 2224.1]SEE15830.1 hypothetical protein SAMN05428940_7138 [Streptomyces sp. 2133.1]